ncbi:MAG TPA: hypothetical protein VGQ89_02400 [Candidatus Limnocylindrales bacterium]|nr:hypothetical protein [Candidatus Limnocylindrales bacterium]
MAVDDGGHLIDVDADLGERIADETDHGMVGGLELLIPEAEPGIEDEETGRMSDGVAP